jgi:hypothetical protein
MRILLCAIFAGAIGCGDHGSASSQGDVNGVAFAARGAASALLVEQPTATSPSGGSVLELVLSDLSDPCAAADSTHPDGGNPVVGANRMVIDVPLGFATAPAPGEYDDDWSGNPTTSGHPCSVWFISANVGTIATAGAMRLTTASSEVDRGNFTFTFGSHGALAGSFDAPRCHALELHDAS